MPNVLSSARRLAALAATALGVAAAAPAPAAAQQSLAPNAWQRFAWYDAPGPIGDPTAGFTFALATPGRLRVVDTGAIGDVFDVLIDGVLRLTTDATPVDWAGVDLGTYDGATEWEHREFWSDGALLLPAGTYCLDLHVRDAAPGYAYGEGWVRLDADASPPTLVTPEPAGTALLGAGLLAIGAVVRRPRAVGRAA